MSTSNFPVSLDTYTNPVAGNFTNNPSLAAGQSLQNDSLTALEAKVGITSSAVTSSLDYKVSNLSSQGNNIYSDSGTVNAYSITPSPAITSYSAGQRFTFLPANTNTNISTLNVSGLGAKAIQFQGSVLNPSQIVSASIVTLIYDGTQFQIQIPYLGAWTNWTPTYSAGNPMTYTSVTTNLARYQQIGKNVTFMLEASGTTAGTATGLILFTLPVTARAATGFISGQVGDTQNLAALAVFNTTSQLAVERYDQANFGLGTNRVIRASGTYEAA